MDVEKLAAVLRLAESGTADDELSRSARDAGLGGTSAAAALTRIAHRARSARRTDALVRVLGDTATDLAAIRDVEAVLLAIVQRTRAVTGADMAYISLNDHAAGQTWIRKSDGVRTPEYANIRMPLGTGVLGKAATGMAVVSTVDYLDDDAIVHLGDIDAIVRKEGVRSILGVPMNVHGRVQGALLIADRRPVEYPPETVEIADAIARQAAVAIDYTARLAHVTEAMERLDAQADVRQARVVALQELLGLEHEMAEILVAGGGVDAILALLAKVHGAPAEFVGPEGLPDEPLLDAALRAAAAGPRPVPVTTGDGGATATAVRVGSRHLGFVVVRTGVAAEHRDVLEHAALHVGLSLLMGQIEADVASRSQHQLLDDLIAGLPGAVTRLAAAGIGARRPKAMLVVGGDVVSDEAARLLRRAFPDALVGSHRRHVCLLHEGAEPLGERALAALQPAGARAFVGSARVAGGDFGRAHRGAEIALAAAGLLGVPALDGDRLGALGALLEADADGRLPGGVVAPAQPLLDAPRGEELVRTAWAVLEFGPRLPAVAKRLYIHPNTLRQRMQRIGTLLGDDWATGPGRLDLHLALRALMIRRTLGDA